MSLKNLRCFCCAATLLLFLSFSLVQSGYAQRVMLTEAQWQQRQAALVTAAESLTPAPTVPREALSQIVAQPPAAPAFFSASETHAGRNVLAYAADYLHYLVTMPELPPAQLAALAESARGLESQHGPVWFLTTLGAKDGISRAIVAPRNTPLFLSLGWTVGGLAEDEPDEFWPELVKQLSDAPAFFYDFEVSLDYQRLPASAVVAGVSPQTYLPLLPQAAAAFGMEPTAQILNRAAIAGNFVMLKPLAPGTHPLKVSFRDQQGEYYLREYLVIVR